MSYGHYSPTKYNVTTTSDYKHGDRSNLLVLLLVQPGLDVLQLLLDLLDVFVHLADRRVQNLPDVEPEGEAARFKLPKIL